MNIPRSVHTASQCLAQCFLCFIHAHKFIEFDSLTLNRLNIHRSSFAFCFEDRSLSRNDYEELQGIVISSHYGTCNHPSVKTYITTNDRKKYPDDRIPLLTNSKPLRRIARIGRHLSVRIITLGILFIGGFLVGSYLLYMQG